MKRLPDHLTKKDDKGSNVLLLPYFQIIEKLNDFLFKQSDRKEFGRIYSLLVIKIVDFAIESSKNIPENEQNDHSILYFVVGPLCVFMGKFKHTSGLQLSSMNNDTLDLLKASMIVQNISFGTVISKRKELSSLDPPNLSPGSYSLCLIVAHLLNSSESLYQMCHTALLSLLKRHWKPKKSSKDSGDSSGSSAGSAKKSGRLNFGVFSSVSGLNYGDLKPLLEVLSAGKDNQQFNATLVFDSELLWEIFLQFCLTMKKLISNAEDSGDLKLFSGPAWDASLINLLCEYLGTPALSDHPLRKVIRRLLGLLCGSKEAYRKNRDNYDIRSRLNFFKGSLVKHLIGEKREGFGKSLIRLLF